MISFSKNSTSNLKRHWAGHPPPCRTGKILTKLQEVLGHPPDVQASLNVMLCKVVVSTGIPLAVVNNKTFREFLIRLDPRFVCPSRQTLGRSILEVSTAVAVEARAAVQKCRYVTLTTDSWTSAANQSYMAVIAHCINDKWERLEVILAVRYLPQSHTAEYLMGILREIACGLNVVACGCENAANILKAVRDAGWEVLPCLWFEGDASMKPMMLPAVLDPFAALTDVAAARVCLASYIPAGEVCAQQIPLAHASYEWFPAEPPRAAAPEAASPTDVLDSFSVARADAGGTSALEWWKVHETKFPQLADLAKRHLCMPPSTTSCERLFSTAGWIVSERRNKLHTKMVEALVVLHKQWDLLDTQGEDDGEDSEGSPDEVED